MNYREMNLTIPHVLFQPRFEPWYDWQQQFGRLPERFRGQSLVEIVDALQVSIRYVHYYSGMPDPAALIATVRELAFRHSVTYLLHSTALSCLDAWLDMPELGSQNHLDHRSVDLSHPTST